MKCQLKYLFYSTKITIEILLTLKFKTPWMGNIVGGDSICAGIAQSLQQRPSPCHDGEDEKIQGRSGAVGTSEGIQKADDSGSSQVQRRSGAVGVRPSESTHVHQQRGRQSRHDYGVGMRGGGRQTVCDDSVACGGARGQTSVGPHL